MKYKFINEVYYNDRLRIYFIMSIFSHEYVDKLLLHYCCTNIDLCDVLKCVNKYYYGIIINNDNYNIWISLLNVSKNYKYSINSKNNLFMHAYNLCMLI